MTWFKVDDTLAFHAKCVAAGNPAMGLWVRSGSWCSQQLNDGFIPDHMVAALGTKGQAKRLVDVVLWHSVPGGYKFHQWNDEGRQPTREEVESTRKEWREKKRRQRRNGAGQYESSPAVSQGDTPGDSSESPTVPSRPVPSRPITTSVQGGSHVSRADGEPPRCSQHKGTPREKVPNCWACGHKREQWEMSLTTDAVFDRAPWCGDDGCNPMTRQRETPFGVIRCPECHPLAEEAS
jgi:hypothetical protein